MYGSFRNRSTSVPTLLLFLRYFVYFSFFSHQFSDVSARQVHSHLLYSPFSPASLSDLQESPKHAVVDADWQIVDEWAGVDGFRQSIESDLRPTPSRQRLGPNASGSPTNEYAPHPQGSEMFHLADCLLLAIPLHIYPQH